MSIIRLKMIVDRTGLYNRQFKAGDVVDYGSWDFEWQGMTEAERVEQGIFVHCHGQGEFEVFREGVDVELFAETGA